MCVCVCLSLSVFLILFFSSTAWHPEIDLDKTVCLLTAWVRDTQRESRESETEGRLRWMDGWRERGSRKNVRGREGRCETETNLTHHDALNIPNKRLLSPSVAGLNCAKEEKKNKLNILNSPSRWSLLSNYRHIVGERESGKTSLPFSSETAKPIFSH